MVSECALLISSLSFFSELLWFRRLWPRRLEMGSSDLRSTREARSGNSETPKGTARPIIKT